MTEIFRWVAISFLGITLILQQFQIRSLRQRMEEAEKIMDALADKRFPRA